ncbi:MAG: hypothetical protein WA144_15525 [Candidatus Methanoperedens sp.]
MITGMLVGMKLSCDCSSQLFVIQVSNEELMKSDDIPVMGDAVKIL